MNTKQEHSASTARGTKSSRWQRWQGMVVLLCSPFFLQSQTPCTVTASSDKNYIITELLQKEETLESNLPALKAPDKMTTVQYLDGLGRPLQRIAVNASAALKDEVSFQVYDPAGRESRVYLPYTGSGCGSYISNAVTAQGSFYSSAANIETTAFPYAETAFEPSPLNRVTAQGAAGAHWQLSGGHTLNYEYSTNTASEVRLYNLGNAAYVYYPAGSLTKRTVKDENWVSTNGTNGTKEEFSDIEGHLVLSRSYTDNKTFDTYYLYDHFGNLATVIPPAARAILVTGPGAATAVLNSLCYQYTYDTYNRLIGKKLPARDWDYIVYDQLDRPVFTQDGSLRLQGKWLFTKYDAFGKVAYTGIYSSTSSRQHLQDLLNEKGAGVAPTALHPLYETRLTSPLVIDGKTLYYTNTALPTTDIQLLTINYYDNYAFDTDGLVVPTGVYGSPVTSRLKGMLTGTKVRVIEEAPTSFWNTAITAYDNRGRSIFTGTQNRYLDYQQQKELKLNFIGLPLEIKSTHTKSGAAAIVVVDQMGYDAAGRLTGHGQRINNQSTERIGTNSYNELGQLITKYVGNSTATSTHLQQINYAYTIRGWLKQINNPASPGTDLFACTLSYNTPQLSGSKAQYNGNISEMSWKTASDNLLRSYSYSYDQLNRITAATGLNTDAGKFSNSNITYDWNGNLLSLTRNGWQNSSTYTNLDVLSYVYDGNRLLSVSDAGNKNYGFVDGNTSGNDYVYNGNGNLIQDKNKKITGITYNYMNLPCKVVFDQGASIIGTVSFAYDARGQKQSKTNVLTGPGIRSTPLVVQYADGYVYEGLLSDEKTLQYFVQDEGYVTPVNVGAQTAYQYVYQYKDHLGNNRLSYTDDDPGSNVHLTIVEESNYDAFGLKHQGYNNVISSLGSSRGQALKYNGKELQEDYGLNWYDYGARFYEPAIARWQVPDPLAEKRNWLSPYNYCQNNPILRLDPNGALDGDYTKSDGTIIGNDGKKDDKVYQVTNKKDIKTIKANTAAGETTDALTVNIAISTNKTELTESYDVLERGKKNGGLKEETSVVTPDGVVSRGKTGELPNGKVARATLPNVPGNDNTSIHLHPTGETANGTGYDALQPGPDDPAAFKNYKQNIIVGPFGPPSSDAYGNSFQRTNGAVFYNRNSVMLGSYSERAIKKILKIN